MFYVFMGTSRVTSDPIDTIDGARDHVSRCISALRRNGMGHRNTRWIIARDGDAVETIIEP